MQKNDHHFLRISFNIARLARQHGNHPFGALLVSADGRPILSSENSVVTGKDATAHAELNLVRAMTKHYDSEFLQTCTMYASAEPCPMCAGAIVWGNIRRVVYGLAMESIYELIGESPDAPGLRMHARQVFERAARPIDVTGPMLEEEARVPHKDFW